MKKTIIIGIVGVMPLAGFAQSAPDAYQLNQTDLRGTARFVSMAGAFTALGGDLTTLGQNPAGLGVYRTSEVGATLDVNMQNVKSTLGFSSLSDSQTKVGCSNVGYVGSTKFGSGSSSVYFNWGFTYGRVGSFDRRYRGASDHSAGSLTNYVAGYSSAEGMASKDLNGYDPSYDPFQQGRMPWMSVLMYNSYGMNPSNDNSTDYEGLYNGTPGRKTFTVDEIGYVDEYNINFGGSVFNTIYWGIGFGITDINYSNYTYYTESFDNATIPSASGNGRTTGSADYGYESYKHMSGSGFNFKIGVIAKPINELRIGFAFHTPTYYNINYDGWAQTQFDYSSRINGYYPNTNTAGCDDYFSFKMRTPWRMMLGVAGVIGRNAIVSVDYEYRPFNQMVVKDDMGYEYRDISSQIKDDYSGVNIIRVGAEYRLTQNFSVRLGYSWQGSSATASAKDGYVYTTGPDDTETQPSFTTDGSINYVTAGIGYHYKAFYIDAAYVYRNRSSNWHAYTASADNPSTVAKLKDTQNSLVFSLGFKF
jgi:hypothetical protein